MNPNYRNVRFRAEMPSGGLPVRFGIVTACNPHGHLIASAANHTATEALRLELARALRQFFPVTGGSPDFEHAEPGFGVVLNDASEIVVLGRRWQQEAVFWVEDNTVTLMPCNEGERTRVGTWMDLAEPPANQPRFYFVGDARILPRPKRAFFCSAKCPGDVILLAHDAAMRWREEEVLIVSGFHSPVERECLRILLRGAQPVVVCPARTLLGFRLPAEWRDAVNQGRMLVVSPFPVQARRTSARLAALRNEFVASLADEVVFGYTTPGGCTERLHATLAAGGRRCLTLHRTSSLNCDSQEVAS